MTFNSLSALSLTILNFLCFRVELSSVVNYKAPKHKMSDDPDYIDCQNFCRLFDGEDEMEQGEEDDEMEQGEEEMEEEEEEEGQLEGEQEEDIGL